MRSERGFTMLELVMVMLIMGILLVLSVSTFNGRVLNLRGQTQILRDDLQVAHEYAVSRMKHHRVRVVSATQYVVERDDGLYTMIGPVWVGVPVWKTLKTVSMLTNTAFVSPIGTQAEWNTRGDAVNTLGTITFTLKDVSRGWVNKIVVTTAGGIL